MRRIALAFPQVEEGTWHGPPVLKAKGKLFVSLREELDSIAIRMPLDLCEEMMTTDPETYYITDHYRDYPWMLVRLTKFVLTHSTNCFKLPIVPPRVRNAAWHDCYVR